MGLGFKAYVGVSLRLQSDYVSQGCFFGSWTKEDYIALAEY